MARKLESWDEWAGAAEGSLGGRVREKARGMLTNLMRGGGLAAAVWITGVLILLVLFGPQKCFWAEWKVPSEEIGPLGLLGAGLALPGSPL